MRRPDLEFLTELARHEPRSTLALGATFAAESPRDVRVAVVGRSSCTMVREEPGLWLGYPVLADPADAPRLARAINRSPVIGLDGTPEDVGPLVPFVERSGNSTRFRRIVVPAAECIWDPVGPDTRVATPLDLPGLEDLFGAYEIAYVRTAGSLRRHLRAAIARRAVIVHEPGNDRDAVAGAIDGAVIAGGLTPQFLVLAHLRVHPSARGHRTGWALIAHAVEMCRAAGVGLVGSLSHSNPMTLPDDRGSLEEHLSVNLSLPDRVPGERMIRRAVWRAQRAGAERGRRHRSESAAGGVDRLTMKFGER